MFGLGTTELIIIAFFLFDTIIVAGVVLFVMAKKNRGSNTANFNANSSESPFHSSTHSSSASPLNATTLDSDEIVNLLRQGRKIEAVKIYRERTNLGLKEAKDAVEEIERRM